MIDYSAIEKKLDYKFENKKLLLEAFTHRSYLNENREEPMNSNERFEFLGDAILQYLASDHIFKLLPDYPEGRLTNLRSQIVNTESLSAEIEKLDISTYLLVSRGEKDAVNGSSHMKANLFEAILGAIYLDSDIPTCKAFLEKTLFNKIPILLDSDSLKDPKSLYQEIAQEVYNITPTYKVLKDEGPDHNKSFEVGLYLENKLVAKGIGASKRKAQQEAAQIALELYGESLNNENN